jgi:biopolymer transport protein ExbB
MLWLTVVAWLARVILLILMALSIWSVAIIIERRRFFKLLKMPGLEVKNSLRSRRMFEGEKHFYSDFLAQLSQHKTSEQTEKFFDAYAADLRKDLEKGLPVLGTLGSTTPFVGLLGTILGIIVSFGELSQGTGSTNSVMFSLAEALILTAVGLIVAIPAVVAFNFFNRKARAVLLEGEILKDLYLAYKE